MKTIPLTKGYVSLVDEEDYERLAKHKWQATVQRSKHNVRIYAKRDILIEGKRAVEYMHRVVVGVSKGIDVDHIDHDGLNNRRGNLRACTRSQNNANMRAQTKCSSKWRGVALHRENGKTGKRWIVQIKKENKNYYLGVFKREENAATAYNFAAHELFGEFAHFNRA